MQIINSRIECATEASNGSGGGGKKGASSSLSTLPVEDHGFVLHKGDFRDALCLQYGWEPTNLLSECTCHASFTVRDALSGPTGGLFNIEA